MPRPALHIEVSNEDQKELQASLRRGVQQVRVVLRLVLGWGIGAASADAGGTNVILHRYWTVPVMVVAGEHVGTESDQSDHDRRTRAHTIDVAAGNDIIRDDGPQATMDLDTHPGVKIDGVPNNQRGPIIHEDALYIV